MSTVLLTVALTSCDDYFKNDYKDNSPTSGKLKVYYDEGLEPHVINQAATFMAQYPRVEIETIISTEDEAVAALYNDSCEAIFISRLLSEKEKSAFSSKRFNPRYSAVAKSGVAVITGISTPVNSLKVSQLAALLNNGKVADSTGKSIEGKVILDRNNSSVARYVLDSVIHARNFSSYCSAAESTAECLSYVSSNPNTFGIIDFSWLSDADDPQYKEYSRKIKFIALGSDTAKVAAFPDQSSFKLGTYPLTRTIYVMRKTGDFTLAKGLEAFVAGPKGQLTFLKQGLLPARQAERTIKVNMEGKPAE